MKLESKLQITHVIEKYNKDTKEKKFLIKSDNTDWIEISENKYNKLLNGEINVNQILED